MKNRGNRRLGIMLQNEAGNRDNMQVPRCSTEAFATGDAALSYSFTSFFLKKNKIKELRIARKRRCNESTASIGLFFFQHPTCFRDTPTPFSQQ